MKTKFRNSTWLLVGLLVVVAGAAYFARATNARKERKTSALLVVKQTFAARESGLEATQGADKRFYALSDVAKMAAEAGEWSKAERYATELLRAAPRHKSDWNYGNAIHDGHTVLGRVALARGDKAGAIKHLLEAGKTPGSPQLNSFGPNMNLAKDLAARGEQQAVITYFDRCKSFWSSDEGRLDAWKSEVEKGAVPEFGANLRY